LTARKDEQGGDRQARRPEFAHRTKPKKKDDMMKLQTPKQKERAQRDAAIYNEYKRLAKNPENAKGAIDEYLASKYGLCEASIYKACKRVEARLAAKKYYGDDDSRAE
jgi:hypothetical protein